MTRHLWNLCFAVLLFASWSSLVPSASGALVTTLTVSVTPQAGGQNLYEYTLTNLSESTLPVFQFDLAVAEDADLQDIAGPSGWGVDYAAGGGFVSFFVDADDAELIAGTTGLFSFLSWLGPIASDYVVVGVAPPAFDVNEGQVGAPGAAAVPEPASLVLSGLGLTLVFGLLRFRG